uniref:Clone 638B transcribed RNA sequence n=1 Tax=Plectreurys tristis TaxID=33319 RepID=A0A0C4W9Q2_PLETR|nr:hypothetical protein [Plectreurys tristis]
MKNASVHKNFLRLTKMLHRESRHKCLHKKSSSYNFSTRVKNFAKKP